MIDDVAPVLGGITCTSCERPIAPDEEHSRCTRCDEPVCSACWVLETRGGVYLGDGRSTPITLHPFCIGCAAAMEAEADERAGWSRDPQPHYEEIVDEAIAERRDGWSQAQGHVARVDEFGAGVEIAPGAYAGRPISLTAREARIVRDQLDAWLSEQRKTANAGTLAAKGLA